MDMDVKFDETADLKEDIDLDVKIDDVVDLKEDIDLDVQIDEPVDLKEDLDMVINVDAVVDLNKDMDMVVKEVKAVDPQEKVAVVKIRKSGQDNIKVIGYGGSDIDTVIYVVDGVHVKKIKEINPDDIESVNVLKEDNLIIIRTKDKSGRKSSGENYKEKIRMVPDDVLYIIDGKPLDKIEVEKLDPDQIESIDVIKGEDEVKKITDRNVKGVIRITSKAKQ